MKKQFRITCTHNPQDFFNGDEPAELCKAYYTSDLESDVSKEIEAGYRVIVTRGMTSMKQKESKRPIQYAMPPARYDFLINDNGEEQIFYNLSMDELWCMMNVYFRSGYEYVYARISNGVC